MQNISTPHDGAQRAYDPSARAAARAGDPETSHEAAASLSAARIRASQEEVLGYLRERGPMSDREIATAALMGGSKQSPSGLRSRRAELVYEGLVRDSGRRQTLPSGRRAIVWEIAGADDR